MVMGKQAFVITCYLQSFMKTNTCPRGKKKLDCITSLDIQIFKKKSLRKSHLLCVPKCYPIHFPPSDRKESNPSHEFAGDRKKSTSFRVSMTSKQTSGQTNRMTYFPRVAIHLSLVIFSFYSYFLLVGLLSVMFVCLHFLAPIF